MSEELPEPAAVDPATLGEPAATSADVQGEAPATDAPGAKINICPACGTRYDDPTTCSNGHDPTQTVEYDRAMVEAADSGDADAVTKVNEAALGAAGNMAGVVQTEATPATVQAIPPVAVAPGAAVDPGATAPGDAAAITAGDPTSAGATAPDAVPGAAPGVSPGAAPAATDAPVATAPGAAVPSTTTTTTPDGIGGTAASAVTPDGMHPNVAAIGAALADLEAAIRAARTALGLG